MKEYSEARQCAKCGSINLNLKYVPEDDHYAKSSPFYVSEHLICKCGSCGFTWKMKTKEYK